MEQPWDFATARQRQLDLSQLQTETSKDVKAAWEEAGESEKAYRVALAKEIIRMHDADGVAWSAAEALARGNEDVASLKRAWDLAEGVKEATTHLAFKHSADRRTLDHLVEWSMRRDMAEGYGKVPVQDGPMFAGSRAR